MDVLVKSSEAHELTDQKHTCLLPLRCTPRGVLIQSNEYVHPSVDERPKAEILRGLFITFLLFQ